MTALLMTGFDRFHQPTRNLREQTRGSDDPLAQRVSTGRVRTWDLISLRASGRVPDAASWADKTLDAIVTAAASKATQVLDCQDCEDLGFYGITDPEDADKLIGLLRREGNGGYEQLTAAGWQPYETRYDRTVEILSREIAVDLAEAIVAGASGLVRRYFWPLAFLPPETMLAAAPAAEAMTKVTAGPEDGWREYAIVDDLDPGAVLELIRLRPGPELLAYRNGVWSEAPEVLTQLQGVQPPPLVELDQAQLDSVIEQVGGDLAEREGEVEGQEDTGDPGEGLDEADKTGPEDQVEGLAAAGKKKGLPKTQTCKYGDEPATKRVVWADGRAYIPVCDKHEAKARQTITRDNKDEVTEVLAIEASGEKKHTLPEGGFPIDNREDLKKAVKAFGRAKNPTAAKRWIIKRARELNAIGLLPEAWGITAAGGALIADAPLTVSPDPRAEKLRRYWTTGKGAAKIRWGTPGDWTRCYRQLRKHMGVRAKGYCQNLHKRATGVWAGDRSNRGRAASLAASGRPAQGVLSMEAALVAAMSTGRWIGPEGGEGMTLKDGVYAEAGENGGLLRTLTAGGFPVAPPDDWFDNPNLDGPTPLTVDDDGRVYGHIATFDVAHIGLPGRVHAPRSKSGYSYFRTGQLITASGKKVNVGQLTLAGGHASLQADAAAAVAHYDNTASAVADVNCGEDRFGIWVAGGVRPEVTPPQLRTLRASAPSGDWRPINGNLELVAVCQVNVPGFPTTRAYVASGAITALVAAGARPLAARKMALLSDAAVAERLSALEAHIFGIDGGPDLVEGEVVLADADGGDPSGSVTDATPAADQAVSETEGQPEVSENVRKAREAAAARRAEREAAQASSPPAEAPQPGEDPQEKQPAEPVEDQPAEEPAPQEAEPEQQDDEAAEREARRAALRARVHGSREPVAASAGGQGKA